MQGGGAHDRDGGAQRHGDAGTLSRDRRHRTAQNTLASRADNFKGLFVGRGPGKEVAQLVGILWPESFTHKSDSLESRNVREACFPAMHMDAPKFGAAMQFGEHFARIKQG